MAGRSNQGGRKGRNRGRGRDRYERSDRVGELLREIIAEELIRIDDDELGFVTVSGVEVDNELFRATVFLSTLDLDNELDLSLIEAHSNRLKKAINNQARLRKIPELRFVVDPGMVQGTRVDEILRDLNEAQGTDDEDPQVPGRAGWTEDPGPSSPSGTGAEEEE